MSERSGTLLVMLKYPTPGRVKTRMAVTVGPERAAAMYRGWIGEVLCQIQECRSDMRLIGATTGAPREAFSAWEDWVDGWWEQPEGDLGERLDAGFRWAHADVGPVLAIGTDCLELDAGLIRDAVARLTSQDAIFGPSGDGGYYLVGTARYLPGFFQGIRWSSEHTLSDHHDVCRASGWSFDQLAPREDIDTWDDWLAYERRRAGSG